MYRAPSLGCEVKRSFDGLLSQKQLEERQYSRRNLGHLPQVPSEWPLKISGTCVSIIP